MAKVEGVNLADAVGYVQLDPGVHLVEVSDGKEGISKAKERKVEFTLANACECDMCKAGSKQGGLIGLNFSLQPKALWKLRQFTEACDLKVTSDGFDTDDYIGKRLKVATSLKEFTNDSGKTESRTQVDDFMSAA